MQPSRSRDLILAAATTGLIVLFWKLRLSDSTTAVQLQSRDAYQQVYPMWLRAAEWMRQGHLPLWNPYQTAGHPFHAAVLYGIFYPFNLARLFLPAEVAMEVTLVLHLVVAWCFTYLYARAGLELGRWGASTAATIFTLCGFVVTEAIWFMPAIGAAVWPPLALLAVEKILAERRGRWVALLAVAVAMPVLAGWLQTWVHMMHALALYVAVRSAPLLWRRETRGAFAFVAVLVAAGVALGLGLASVQLLPSFELQQMGWRRPGGLTIEQQFAGGLASPAMLLAQMIAADPGFPRPNYVGIATLLLLPLALVSRAERRGRVIALVLVLVWSVGVSMTVWTPLFSLYRAIPGGTWFRIPWRMMYFASLSLAALAGVAVDSLASGQSSATKRGAAVLAAFAGAALFAVGLSARAGVYTGIAAVAILCLAWAASPQIRRVALVVLFAVATIDLFCSTWTEPQRPYQNLAVLDREHEVLDYIKEHQGFGRTYVHDAWPFTPEMMAKQGTLREIFMLSDYEVLSRERYAKYCRAMAQGPGPQFVDTTALGICVLSPQPERLKMLDRLGARFALLHKASKDVAKYFLAGGWKLALAPPDSEYVLLENPAPLPRAYVAYNRVFAGNEEQALGFASRRAMDPWISVILERPGESGEAPPNVMSQAGIAPAEIVRYEPNVVEIEADASADGYLVLADSDYPGWNAYVDGVATEILRANYLFRAVPIAPGHHRVVFVFEPKSVWIGGTLSLLSLMAIAALAFYGPWWRARPRATAISG